LKTANGLLELLRDGRRDIFRLIITPKLLRAEQFGFKATYLVRSMEGVKRERGVKYSTIMYEYMS